MTVDVRHWPGVHWLRERRFLKGFAGPYAGTHRGIFATFEEARRSAPGTKPVGFDNGDPSVMYMERHHQVYPSDYPVLFWLLKWLGPDASKVFDLGGHLGISYFAFSPYLDFKPELRWTVFDVPAVRQAGTALATKKGVSNQLRFAESLTEASQADILLALGSLQFVDGPSLGALLRSLVARPRWLLINKTPLTPGPSFVTLQNAGTVFTPCQVVNDDEFIRDILSAGYRLLDRWENADMGCHLPMNPERSVRRHTGLAFERVS